MICNNCKIRVVCKVYDLRQTFASLIGLNVRSCYFNSDSSAIAFEPIPSIVPGMIRKQRTPEQIQKISEKIRQAQETKSPPAVIKAECAVCKSTEEPFYRTCTHCGKPLCNKCVISSEKDGKDYCPDCYGKVTSNESY